MRGRKRRHGRREWVPSCSIAFGAGMFVALCFSLRLTLLLAACLLIYVGVTSRC